MARVPKSAAASDGHKANAGKPMVIWFAKNYYHVPLSAVASMCKHSNVYTDGPEKLGKLLPCKSAPAWVPYLDYKTLVLLVGDKTRSGSVYTTFAVPDTPEQRIMRVVWDRVAEKNFPELAIDFDKTVDVGVDSNSRERTLKRRATLEWRKGNPLDFKVHLVVRPTKNPDGTIEHHTFTRDWYYEKSKDTASNWEMVPRTYQAEDGDTVVEFTVPGCNRPQLLPEAEGWKAMDKSEDNLKTVVINHKPVPRKRSGTEALGDDDEEEGVRGTVAARGGGTKQKLASSSEARAPGALLSRAERRGFMAYEQILELAHDGPFHVQRAGPGLAHVIQYTHEDPELANDNQEEEAERDEAAGES